MRVLLVRPKRRKQAITLGEFMFSEPIGLECVYAVLKEAHEIRILDLMTEKEDFLTELKAWQPDVVGFTSLCIDVLSVLELAQETKALNPSIITIVGGTQTLLSPESFFCKEIDHVMKFTTVINLQQLFNHLEKEEKVPLIDGIHSKANGFQGTGTVGINDYIIPDRSSTIKYRKHYSYFGYKPCAIMQTSRGCSARCTFCLRWHIEGSREQDEPLESIIKQIQEIEEPSIMFYDNNFLNNRERLEKFCDLLEAHRIKKNFICYGSVRSIISHPETVKRLGQNGLQAVLVGYESFSEAELKSYNKQATVEQNLAAAKILHESQIDCWASFILHPDWDTQDFKKFRSYLKKLRPEVSSLVPMTPFPGSNLHKKYKNRLLFNTNDYDMWSFSIVSIQPAKMSLRRYYYQVLKTNLYVNLFMNNPFYMSNKFGYGTMFRVFKGSLKFLFTYIELMFKG